MASLITSPVYYTKIVSKILNNVGSERIKPLVQIPKHVYDDVTGLFFVYRCTAKPEKVKL